MQCRESADNGSMGIVKECSHFSQKLVSLGSEFLVQYITQYEIIKWVWHILTRTQFDSSNWTSWTLIVWVLDCRRVIMLVRGLNCCEHFCLEFLGQFAAFCRNLLQIRLISQTWTSALWKPQQSEDTPRTNHQAKEDMTSSKALFSVSWKKVNFIVGVADMHSDGMQEASPECYNRQTLRKSLIFGDRHFLIPEWQKL